MKSVRSTTDVSHDGWPNLPDVVLPGGMHPLQHETQLHTCSLQGIMFFVFFGGGGGYFMAFILLLNKTSKYILSLGVQLALY